MYDPNKHTTIQIPLADYKVIGFQTSVNGFCLEALIKAIRNGDQLPPIPILDRLQSQGAYYLDPEPILMHGDVALLDGGHTRAVAYHTLGLPLHCYLSEDIGQTTKVKFPIQALGIDYSSFAKDEYQKKKECFPKYFDVDLNLFM